MVGTKGASTWVCHQEIFSLKSQKPLASIQAGFCDLALHDAIQTKRWYLGTEVLSRGLVGDTGNHEIWNNQAKRHLFIQKPVRRSTASLPAATLKPPLHPCFSLVCCVCVLAAFQSAPGCQLTEDNYSYLTAAFTASPFCRHLERENMPSRGP